MISSNEQLESSANDMFIESEFDEHQKGINYVLYSSRSLEDKMQFSNQFVNQPLDIKSPVETVQEYLFTEEKLEVSGKGLNNTQLLKSKFVNIKLLDLAKCKLQQIPDDIYKMVNLQKLFLGQNSLAYLPKNLENLKYLNILDLSYNQLQIFDLQLKSLKQLNLACNYIEIPCLLKLEVLCLQMNPIHQLPQEFSQSLETMTQFEFDWFKYCKPALPLKLNFNKYPSVHLKMQNALSFTSLNFLDFIKLMSLTEQDFYGTDYKERNLFCQAGMNDDIGVLYGLNKIIHNELNKMDFDSNTPLTVAYIENKLRSVSVLKSFGAKFSSNAIHCISQRADINNLQYLMGVGEIYKLKACTIQHSINEESLVMLKNVDGNTPFHQLMMNFDRYETSTEYAYMLLQYGADPNIENFEGCTPLDMAVKKQQLKGIKFAHLFNSSKKADFSCGRYFNFQYQSSLTGQGICHTAVMSGNFEILEYLLSINADFFQVSKSNKLPKNLATQSLSQMKNFRKIEKRWIFSNIRKDQSLLEQQEKNVYQMKNQIEKNLAQRQHNMIQKYLDQEEIEIDNSVESYNELSLQVGSESSVREAVAESAPIFQKQITQKDIINQVIKNMDSLNALEFPDHLPDTLKLLRSGNIDFAIKKLKNILANDNLPASERVKYKIQLMLLKFKFKQKRIELRAQVGNEVSIILNEFQFKTVKSESRTKYFKELQQILIEQNKFELQKANQIITRQKIICSSYNLNRDLKVQDISVISDLRARLSNSLIYDINNYASHIFSSQTQISNWLYVSNSKTEKIMDMSSFYNLQNYEYLQQMKFKKRKVIFEKNEDFNIEKDKADVYTVQANQIICNNNSLFCNTKRF